MGALLDIVVIVLLSFTISFCLRLNKKISDLKDSRKELVDLVRTFDTAVISTHKSISALKETSSIASGELKTYISKAEGLTSDLSFMTDAASRIADRLENLIDSSKKLEQSIKIGSASLENVLSEKRKKTISKKGEEAISKKKGAKR
ncbi:conserved hypothetical protein [Alphaproteobacteria bacterium]